MKRNKPFGKQANPMPPSINFLTNTNPSPKNSTLINLK